MEPFEQMFYYVLSGLLWAVLLLWIVQNKHWKWLGQKPGFSPNWITLWSTLIFWIGVDFYFGANSYLGFQLIVIGMTLDRIDGKMATLGGDYARSTELQTRWEQLWEEFNFFGRTSIGQWFDPLMDKFRLLPLLVILASKGYLPFTQVLLVVALDVFSTFMRAPFQLVPDNYLRGASATGFGKFKVACQFSTAIFVLPVSMGWATVSPHLLAITLDLALAFGALSTLSRVDFHGPLRPLNKLVDLATKPFGHDVL